MIRIGFVFPSSEYLFDPFRGDPHTHFQILTVLEHHFGDKIEPLLIDLRGIKKEFAIYHVPECDIYLHSVYTLDYNEQTAIVKNLRDRYPKAKHLAGGPHAIEFQEQCLQIFDALILGDGEESIIQAVQDFMDQKLTNIYDQKNPVDTNLYPYPRRKYLPKSTVARKGLVSLKNKRGLEELVSTTVIFSRGCPYKCYFCHMPNSKKMGMGIRFRDPQFIEQEIEYLKRDYGIQALSLLDEICMPLIQNKAIEHLEAIGRTGVLWKAQCRVDGINLETARLAKQAGCMVMCMGVESVHQTSLDIINKKISIEQTKKSIHLLKSAGIEVRLYMIMGLPGEPADIVEKTWKFIQETQPDLVYMSLLAIRPGTEMFKNPEKFGFKWISQDWDKTMHLFSRYENETPVLTYQYHENTNWGKSLPNDQIVSNYLEIQKRLKENNLCTR